MKLQDKRTQVKTLGALRANLLVAIAKLDLKGTDSKVTQAMCIIEEAFNSTASGHQLNAKRIFRLGIAKAKLVA